MSDVIIDDPAWEEDWTGERIQRLEDLIREQHEALHEGAIQWCANALCKEVQG